MNPTLEFRLLGPVSAWVDGREVPIGHPRQRCVLAVLLLEPNQAVPTDRLLARVWDGDPPLSARNLLSGYMTRLRAAINEAGVSQTQLRRLRESGGYRLDVDPGRIDLHRFRSLVEAARRSAGDAAAVTLFRRALGAWTGPTLAGIDSERIGRVRDGLEDERLVVRLECHDAEVRLGRHASIVSELTALAEAQPLHEGVASRLMTALYRCGRTAAALDRYAAVRRRLVEDLGVEPGPELQRLHRQVLRGEVSPSADERASAGRTPARGDTTAPVVPAQLPADVPDFTGRAAQLNTLQGWLPARGDPATRISVIVGTAGMGKTALAVHWAHRVRRLFPDGQLYVNLRGHATGPPMRPIQALAHFLQALGVASECVPTDVEAAAGLYRSLLADKRLMVVLDNAAGPEQVRSLVPAGPGCLVLVTSRQTLTGMVAANGARHLTLGTLTPDEARTLLTRTLGDRLLSADPDAADELAHACGYLPLALRIAAANIIGRPHASLAGEAAELRADDRLNALEVAGDDQAAVRAAFDLSYATLRPAERRLFRLLGLVPGADFTAEVAAALAELPVREAALLLDRLAGAHLVDPHPHGRYAMHDLLRLYAVERAGIEEAEPARTSARRRLCDWYLRSVDTAAQLIYPGKLRLPMPPFETHPVTTFDDRAAALDWLDAERANLVALVGLAAEAGPAPAAWLIADAVRGYFQFRMHLIDWNTVAQAGLASAEAAGDRRGQTAAHLSLADIDAHLSHHARAIDRYTRALDLCDGTWPEAQAAVLSNLAIAHQRSGRVREAVDHYTRSLDLARRFAMPIRESMTLVNLGTAYRELGRLDECFAHNHRALAIWREVGAADGVGIALCNLGEVCHLLGRLPEAVTYLTEALTVLRDVGDRTAETETLATLAAAHRDAGRYTEAVEVGRAALAEHTGDPQTEATALTALAGTYERLRRFDEALDGYRQALRLARTTGDPYPETDALIGLVGVHRHLDDANQAIAYADQALRTSRTAGYRLLEGRALAALAEVHLAGGRLADAVGCGRQALDIHRATGYRLGNARSLTTLGTALHRTGDTDAAQRHWREALTLATDIGSADADDIRELLSSHPPAHPT